MTVEDKALELLRGKLAVRCPGTPIAIVSSADSSPLQGVGDPALTILAGTVESCATLADAMRSKGLRSPTKPESFLLHSDGRNILVCGADSRGVLYGIGRLLRHLDYRTNGVSCPEISKFSAPAVADRGVYFATHFNNYYECAPVGEVVSYLEELALWGCNAIFYWFDMNWFPAGFWKIPDSKGMRMIARLRAIATAARDCGMRVGIMGVANEGFSGQPPQELRADISARRGGFYPDSQICPSKPGGLEMILENRRIVLDLLGPTDFFVYWPYDQGGCGCADCADEMHRWGKTFLRIGPEISALVKELNPSARFLVSTWYMDEVERAQVYSLCDSGAGWFDGIVMQTYLALERPAYERYSRWVFPEISMFDCFFTSYGCNGANPAPSRFVGQARETAAAGCGEMLYSEGMYEDVNKVTWLAVLWNPARGAGDIAEEYGRYYLGAALAGADLLQRLETTWGPKKLRETSVETAESLLVIASSLEAGLPDDPCCRARWRQLRDRAEIDALMLRIGPDTPLIQQARRLYEEACTGDDDRLRGHIADWLPLLDRRLELIEELFDIHWRYLRCIHTERTTLIFTPDEFLGQHNWKELAVSLHSLMENGDGQDFQEAVVRSFKRWFWFNGINLDFLYL